MEITLSISKEDVMQEIAVTTAYTGGKMDNDEPQTYPVESKGEVKYVEKNQANRYKSGILELDADRMIKDATFVTD